MGQPHIPSIPAGTKLTNKTVVVTGANAGLGLEAARQYLALDAKRVILAVRSVTKGEEAKEHLLNHPSVKSVNPNADIIVMALDLDDEASVVKFASKVKSELDVLDVLLLNGGVNIMNYQTSKNGHERVMQVNYHSNALLALELLPLLESTASVRGSPSRLTFVGSVGMSMHTLKKQPLGEKESVAQRFDDKTKYASFQRYSDSKLMVAAFAEELAEHVPANKVIINYLCPGMVSTGFDAHLPFWLKSIMALVRWSRARNVDEGARTYIHATSVKGAETHGKFVRNNELAEYVFTISLYSDNGLTLRCVRSDAILSQPEGAVLRKKAWNEALQDAEKFDPQFKRRGLI